MDLFTNPWSESGCIVNDVPTLLCVWPAFNNLINAAILFSGVVALFFIIRAGYGFITSQGDPEAVSSARQTLFYAIAGLVFIILSFFIFNFVFDIVGLSGDDFLEPPSSI